VMGTNNVDHCTRLCHSPSVEAMLAQLGSGATSNSYSDYEAADCLFVVGADPSSNHPVAASRMRTAVDRGAALIVLNPKRIELCDHTDLWLRQYPGTDVAVLNGMAKVILDEGLADQPFIAERTEGYDGWLAELDEYTPAAVEAMSGVPADLLIRAARTYAQPKPTDDDPGGSCLIWGMGVTQHTNGTANATALLNLALLTGQMGRVGNGVSPLRGQNNVQGAGDAGCIPDALPGYQRYTPDVLEKFNSVWESDLPSAEGLRATDIMQGVVFGTGIDGQAEDPRLKTRLDFDQCFGTVVNRFCCQAVIGHPLTPYGEGGQKRGFLPLRDVMQCLSLVIDSPPQAGDYRVINQFDACYTVNEIASMVRQVAAGEGMEVDILPLENPRLESTYHEYQPDREKLPALGYQPSGSPMWEIRKMLIDLLPHRQRIEARAELLLPDIRWDGLHRRSRAPGREAAG